MNRIVRCMILLSCLCLTAITFYRFSGLEVQSRFVETTAIFFAGNGSGIEPDKSLIFIQRPLSSSPSISNSSLHSSITIASSLDLRHPSSDPLSSNAAAAAWPQLQQFGCLRHEPMMITASGVGINETDVTLEMKLQEGCGPLRRDWRDNPPLSPFAQMILQLQSNCSYPFMGWNNYHFSGIGSHFAHWSRALCVAWQRGRRIQSFNPSWMWLDQTYCNESVAVRSPFLCYFPKLEDLCQDAQEGRQPTRALGKHKPCRYDKERGFVSAFRTAAIEYVFRAVSPLVIQEAQRQVGVLFGPNGAPDDLITVHVRWGDKGHEMQLVAIGKYVQAVWNILEFRRGKNNNKTNAVANIYLATEDPEAADAFVQAAPKQWNVYIDVAICSRKDHMYSNCTPYS